MLLTPDWISTQDLCKLLSLASQFLAGNVHMGLGINFCCHPIISRHLLSTALKISLRTVTSACQIQCPGAAADPKASLRTEEYNFLPLKWGMAGWSCSWWLEDVESLQMFISHEEIVVKSFLFCVFPHILVPWQRMSECVSHMGTAGSGLLAVSRNNPLLELSEVRRGFLFADLAVWQKERFFFLIMRPN